MARRLLFIAVLVAVIVLQLIPVLAGPSICMPNWDGGCDYCEVHKVTITCTN